MRDLVLVAVATFLLFPGANFAEEPPSRSDLWSVLPQDGQSWGFLARYVATEPAARWTLFDELDSATVHRLRTDVAANQERCRERLVSMGVGGAMDCSRINVCVDSRYTPELFWLYEGFRTLWTRVPSMEEKPVSRGLSQRLEELGLSGDVIPEVLRASLGARVLASTLGEKQLPLYREYVAMLEAASVGLGEEEFYELQAREDIEEIARRSGVSRAEAEALHESSKVRPEDVASIAALTVLHEGLPKEGWESLRQALQSFVVESELLIMGRGYGEIP